MPTARGLFDEQFRLEKLSQKKDPLERLSSHIDFEFFRKPLSVLRDSETDPSRGGRPSYDEVLMFKILILQRYYNISDDNTEVSARKSASWQTDVFCLRSESLARSPQGQM
jgi:hypothetical protein